MKNVIVKKALAGIGLAVYATGVIGCPITLAIDGHWLFAFASLAVSIFGIPYAVEAVQELFKKSE